MTNEWTQPGPELCRAVLLGWETSPTPKHIHNSHGRALQTVRPGVSPAIWYGHRHGGPIIMEGHMSAHRADISGAPGSDDQVGMDYQVPQDTCYIKPLFQGQDM